MKSWLQKTLRYRPELVFFVMVLTIVNGPWLGPALTARLVFLPEASFDGEWWRWLTHPWVHVSGYHFLLDATAFLLLLHEIREPGALRRTLLVTGAALGSVGLPLLADPAIYRHGLCGLSGVAHGLTAIWGLEWTRAKENPRWATLAGWITLVAVILKSLYECASGQVLLAGLHLGPLGHPIASCHLGGVLGGLAGLALIRRGNRFPGCAGLFALAVNRRSRARREYPCARRQRLGPGAAGRRLRFGRGIGRVFLKD